MHKKEMSMLLLVNGIKECLRKKNHIAIRYTMLVFFFCPLFVIGQQPVNIIPQPVSLQQQPGHFILTGNTAVHVYRQNNLNFSLETVL